ncbi:hypothetical protein SAMN05444410_101402 [Hydrobacter penzbergensis]|uniref:Protein argonaute n=1 Tax=Hydrobacter penzbergensis TaxID=1235997 RepID=A0A8X8L9Z3_9BACT|nr:hypothetical protein SAMN05444410_101402 [Hydrobacter penzbergensis]
MKFPFKLMQLELQEIENDPALNNRNMQKVLMKIASVTSGPVAVYFKDGKKFIAVKADTEVENVEISLAPMIAKATLLPGNYDLNFNSLTSNNRELAIRFLEFAVKEHLGNHPKLWRYSAYQYFLRKPIFNEPHSQIDVFSGFNFKIVPQPDGHFYIALDLSYKYTDKKFLHEHLAGEDIEVMKKRLKGRKCLYFGGDSWYQVQIASLGKAIKEQDFALNGKKYTVLDWAMKHTKSETFNMQKHLFPDTPALIFNYPGNTSKYFNGAACLAKMLYTTADDFVNGMHNKTIQNPNNRFYYLRTFIKHNFQGIVFNGVELKVNQYPLSETLKIFPLPGLKFNNGIEMKSLVLDERYERAIEDFGKLRRANIMRNGILNKTQFNPQYLLVPDSIDFQLAKAIQSTFSKDMKLYARNFEEFTLIVYKDLKSSSAYRQYNEIKDALSRHNATHGNALFLLPDAEVESAYYIRNLHDCVKKNFYKSIKFQCASARKVASFYSGYSDRENGYIFKLNQDGLRSYRSYISNLFFEYLIVNQKWAYALSQPLNHDIYIGLDVHDHYAGFLFFYRNGEKIVFDYTEVSNRTGTFRNEKISAKVIIDKLLENLKRHIPQHAKNPNSIILLRDGRSFGEEGKAMKTVLGELAKDGLIDANKINWGIVDIHKNTAIPYRVALEKGGYNNLSNPISGTYKLFDATTGFLFTTGYPFKIPGTVQPIHITLVEGNADFESVMQDIFHQCILAFSAPDKGGSLPVVLKLIDTMIRSFAHSLTEKSLEEQEEQIFD